MRTVPKSRNDPDSCGIVSSPQYGSEARSLGPANDNLIRAVRLADCALYQGDAFPLMPNCGDVDCIITDPPYNAKTHKGARSAKSLGASQIDFDSLSDE
jgi:hypothetical protein